MNQNVLPVFTSITLIFLYSSAKSELIQQPSKISSSLSTSVFFCNMPSRKQDLSLSTYWPVYFHSYQLEGLVILLKELIADSLVEMDDRPFLLTKTLRTELDQSFVFVLSHFIAPFEQKRFCLFLQCCLFHIYYYHPKSTITTPQPSIYLPQQYPQQFRPTATIYNQEMNNIPTLLILIVSAASKCVYTQPQSGLPYVVDVEAFPQNYTQQICKDYIGKNVCCNSYNAKLAMENFKALDATLSNSAGGCDICAINVKRLWCEYACSPRQSEFLKVSKEYYVYPDPEKPGFTIVAQQANLTIEASTACALFVACQRVPFVSAVSAMGSPAGFLNFQGRNAIDNAKQYINVFFTNNKSQGVYFGPDTGQQYTAESNACDYKGTELHGFAISKNCSCNDCDLACDPNDGFKYSEPSVFEGFNLPLVAGFYGFVLTVTGILTYCRYKNSKRKQE